MLIIQLVITGTAAMLKSNLAVHLGSNSYD